jgi:hypothetical protein
VALNDYYGQKFASIDAFTNRVFPTDGPIIQLGEPLAKGFLLANGIEALAKYNCPVPRYKTQPQAVFFKGSSTAKGDQCIQFRRPSRAAGSTA